MIAGALAGISIVRDWPAETDASDVDPLTTVTVWPLTVAFHGRGAEAGARTVTAPVMVNPFGTVTMTCRRKCEGPLWMLFITVKLKFLVAPDATSFGLMSAE